MREIQELGLFTHKRMRSEWEERRLARICESHIYYMVEGDQMFSGFYGRHKEKVKLKHHIRGLSWIEVAVGNEGS